MKAHHRPHLGIALALAYALVGAVPGAGQARADAMDCAARAGPKAPNNRSAGPAGDGWATWCGVRWRDRADNEEGFTVEYRARIDGVWVLAETNQVEANQTYVTFNASPCARLQRRWRVVVEELGARQVLIAG